LIEIDSTQAATVRLGTSGNLTSRMDNIKYLILSYCWGKSNDPAKTTSTNIEQRKSGISVFDLPKTIQDAILITRLMGIHYLWVDALCIIQGDGNSDTPDWRREAGRMGLYYANALCCICASVSSDSSGGFLAERELARFSWFQHSVPRSESNGEIKGTYSVLPPRMWLGEELKQTPLMTRAWCFREWMLSRRILHWTRSGLYWECAETISYESLASEALSEADFSPGFETGEARRIFETAQLDAFKLRWPQVVKQ
jgi:hypothetical protein